MALTEKQKQQRIDYARKNLKRIPLDVQKKNTLKSNPMPINTIMEV